MLGIHGVGRGQGRLLPVRSRPGAAGVRARPLGRRGGRRARARRVPSSRRTFRRLLEGRHPRTGRPIGSGRTTVAAFDLTFSAPKSASVLFALGGEAVARRVVAAHAEAVAGALSYLEQHAVTAARRDGVRARRDPDHAGSSPAVFTHAVNRNGDPHLHSHVVMANLVHGADGRWSACDRRGFEAHRQAAVGGLRGAPARRAERQRSACAGPAVPGRSAEIVGVGPQLLGEFSTRGADIRRHMHEIGARSGRGGRVAWAATRPAKAPGSPLRRAGGGVGPTGPCGRRAARARARPAGAGARTGGASAARRAPLRRP